MLSEFVEKAKYFFRHLKRQILFGKTSIFSFYFLQSIPISFLLLYNLQNGIKVTRRTNERR